MLQRAAGCAAATATATVQALSTISACLRSLNLRPARLLCGLQSLAAEVVALEEQQLRLKMAHLKDKAQASGASEVVAAMQAQMEAASKDRRDLLQEVARLRDEAEEARLQLRRLQRGGNSAAAAAAADGQEQQGDGGSDVTAQELERAREELAAAQRRNAELQQQLRQAPASASAAPGGTPTASAAGATSVSAGISQQALLEAGSGHAAQGSQLGGLPAELAALLPSSLYTLRADGLGGDAAPQLASSIHLLLDAVEQDKRALVAALNAKQVGCAGRWQGDGLPAAMPRGLHHLGGMEGGACTDCRLVPLLTPRRMNWSSSCAAGHT